VCIDPFGQEHQFTGPRRPGKPGQQPRNAVIAGERNPGITSRHDSGFGRDTNVAGERDRKPSASRRSRQGRDGGFTHRDEYAGQGSLTLLQSRNLVAE
jgi:hypothetical protein